MYNPAFRMRQYHQQAVLSASPEQLVAKLYDLAVTACHRDDRQKLRAVLAELIASLNFERGGDIAQGLYNVYDYCMRESAAGSLELICELLTELRDTWKQHVIQRQAA